MKQYDMRSIILDNGKSDTDNSDKIIVQYVLYIDWHSER